MKPINLHQPGACIQLYKLLNNLTASIFKVGHAARACATHLSGRT